MSTPITDLFKGNFRFVNYRPHVHNASTPYIKLYAAQEKLDYGYALICTQSFPTAPSMHTLFSLFMDKKLPSPLSQELLTSLQQPFSQWLSLKVSSEVEYVEDLAILGTISLERFLPYTTPTSWLFTQLPFPLTHKPHVNHTAILCELPIYQLSDYEKELVLKAW